MAKYLVHHFMDGTPVGVWGSDGDHFYPTSRLRARTYAERVLANADFSRWDEVVELWAGRAPNGTARWSDFESDAETLEEVFGAVEQEYGE